MSLRYRSKIFREHFGPGKGNPKRFRHLAFPAERRRRTGPHGVSMEEEHRRILREALGAGGKKPMSFKDFLLSMPDVGDGSIFKRARSVVGRATGQNTFED